MRIVISSEENKGLDSQVSHHFGRCAFFTVVDLEGEQILNVESIENPYFAQHTPGQVPEFISNQQANVMISGGMGKRAIDFFQQLGVEAVTGAAGTAEETLQRFLRGEMPSVQPCSDSVDHGEHEHHHHH